MILKTVFVRFYKSFNFDYLRKFDSSVTNHLPWESADGLWYPYVRIPIDAVITTVVGANESGKTHLLTAIEKGIGGTDIVRADFCRYSKFFTVEAGKMRWPDFGFEWSALTTEERQTIAQCCGITKPVNFESFLVFRTDKDKLTVYLPNGATHKAHELTGPALTTLADVVPNVFRLYENIGLPDSAPIRWLAGDVEAKGSLERLSRKRRVQLFEKVLGNPNWFSSKETVTQSAEQIVGAFSPFSSEPEDSATALDTRLAELELARDLIRKIAKIDAEALSELYEALRDGKDAFANSIIDAINSALESALNFPHWWVQDREFRLLVSPRDYDLVFTIRDRTGREYSFGERSSGLKYFLSYYIQYLAHEPLDARPEILLMDEPDAFLSSQGQQDLLKIFEAFAKPDRPGRIPTQVIYVTHSPFLIDKNHGERIRVLEKGVGEEGTRVVRDASRNHYEPLRSAFGSYVAETTFIGHCNLMVEGPADQILLAGAATFLRGCGASTLETLDLNKITIVPAGSAGHIPYLVYLARGRDIEKPAVIVFLDSDDQGNRAKKDLQRGGAKGKQLLKPQYILQVGDLSQTPVKLNNSCGNSLIEAEDLIPLSIAAEATQRYLRTVCNVSDETVLKLTPESISAHYKESVSLFDAIAHALTAIDADLHIEKVGFARLVVDVVLDFATKEADAKNREAAQAFESNMKALFKKLRQMQRDAERELTTERVSRRVERAKQSFLQDHPDEARREHAFVLLEEIEASLDNSQESDHIRAEISGLRRDFKVEDDVTEPVPNYGQFKDRLDKLKYAGRLATQESEAAAFGEMATITSDQEQVVESVRNDQQDGEPTGAAPIAAVTSAPKASA